MTTEPTRNIFAAKSGGTPGNPSCSNHPPLALAAQHRSRRSLPPRTRRHAPICWPNAPRMVTGSDNSLRRPSPLRRLSAPCHGSNRPNRPPVLLQTNPTCSWSRAVCSTWSDTRIRTAGGGTPTRATPTWPPPCSVWRPCISLRLNIVAVRSWCGPNAMSLKVAGSPDFVHAMVAIRRSPYPS